MKETLTQKVAKMVAQQKNRPGIAGAVGVHFEMEAASLHRQVAA